MLGKIEPALVDLKRGAKALDRGGDRRGRGFPALDRRPQLHLPRLRLLRPFAREGRRSAAPRRRLGDGSAAPPGGPEPERELAQLRSAAAGGAPSGPPAGAADHHQGQQPLDRASPGLSRLHRRAAVRRQGQGAGRASLPRPVHVRRLQPQSAPDPAAAAQGRADHRAGQPAARQPLRQGAGQHHRDLSARRAVPGRRRRAVRDRQRDPASAGAPADPGVRPARRLRALRLLPDLRAARALRHRPAAQISGDPAAGVQRHRGRLPGAAVGIDPRPDPVHRAHARGHPAGGRSAGARAPAARGRALLGRRAAPRADRGPWRGGGQPALSRLLRGDPARLSGAGAGARRRSPISTGSTGSPEARAISRCRSIARSRTTTAWSASSSAAPARAFPCPTSCRCSRTWACGSSTSGRTAS